jgi:abortive infection bacteriophage resistance protein
VDRYPKPHLSFADQLKLLIDRGMEVTDPAMAADYLERIGYYRLGAYWYSLREWDKDHPGVRSEHFVEGSRFQDVVDLYVFDKRLRLLLFDMVERIEVAVRVDVAYLLGEKDRFAQTNASLFDSRFAKKPAGSLEKTKHEKWLLKYDKAIADSREVFVTEFKKKYDLPLPIWISKELWDFGMLSTLYAGMLVPDKQKIAGIYGIPDWRVMQSWLWTLSVSRNVMAHHARLWNSNLVAQPRLPTVGSLPSFDHLVGDTRVIARVYVVLCIMIHFLGIICPRSSWKKRLRQHLETLPKMPLVSLADMGFPSGWQDQALWKR